MLRQFADSHRYDTDRESSAINESVASDKSCISCPNDINCTLRALELPRMLSGFEQA